MAVKIWFCVYVILALGVAVGQAPPAAAPGAIQLSAEEKTQAENLALKRQIVELQAEKTIQQARETLKQLEESRRQLETKFLKAHSLDPAKYRLDDTAMVLAPVPTPPPAKPSPPPGTKTATHN